MLIVICGGALGLSLEGTETFRGAAVIGTGYEFAVAKDGRRPGCENARLRPVVPELAMTLAGSEDCVARSGDAEPFNGDGEVALFLR